MSTRPITTQPSAVVAPARPMPASAPPEVLTEMATAAGAQDRLAASGRSLHFSVQPSTGSLSVQVTDLQGNVLGTVAPSTALHVAGGGTLE